MAFVFQKTLRQVVLPAGQLNFAVRALSASLPQQMKRPTFDRPLPPKRALNAYMLFLLDNAQSVPKTETGKLNLKAIGDMWRNLTLVESKVYHTKAATEQILYKRKYEEFLRSIGGKKKQEAYLEELKEYKSERREYMKNFRLKKKDLLKPRKRSGYNMFISELMKKAEVKSLEDTQAIMKGAAVKWKALGDKMKAVYNEEATLLHEQQLKAFERRLKKAEKAGIVPKLDADGEKVKTTAKKAAPKKKKTTTDVAKAIAALLSNDDLKGVIAQTLKEKDLGVKGEVLAAALKKEEEEEEIKAEAEVAADAEEIASLAEEVVCDVVEEAEDLDEVGGEVAEGEVGGEEGAVEGDLFTDSDTEASSSGTVQV